MIKRLFEARGAHCLSPTIHLHNIGDEADKDPEQLTFQDYFDPPADGAPPTKSEKDDRESEAGSSSAESEADKGALS